MDDIFVNGGTVRIYFKNEKQRALDDVYNVKYNDSCMTVNINNGTFCIVNLDEVSMIEIKAIGEVVKK